MAIKSKNKKILYLIDGMPLVYRAYYALINSPLFTSSGFNSSAVYGYVNTLLQIIDEVKSNHIVVVFDVSRSKRRITEYPEYKGNRQKTPEDILVSLPYVKRLTEALGVATFSLEDVEADDVIGTLTLMAEKKGFKNYIITPDKDFAQLVSQRTFLYRLPRKNRDKPDVLDRAGIKDTEMIIAVTQTDEVNMVACQVAYTVFNVPKKIARIRETEYIAHESLFSHDSMPIDVLITPEMLVSNYIQELISHPGAHKIFMFESYDYFLIEIIKKHGENK